MYTCMSSQKILYYYLNKMFPQRLYARHRERLMVSRRHHIDIDIAHIDVSIASFYDVLFMSREREGEIVAILLRRLPSSFVVLFPTTAPNQGLF